MSNLSAPHFHNEAAAIEYLEGIIYAKEWRVNKCRRFGRIVVESPRSCVEVSRVTTEAKDGIPVCSRVCARCGRSGAGVLSDAVGEGSAAVCGGGGAAAGTWWRGVCRRRVGMFAANHRTRAARVG